MNTSDPWMRFLIAAIGTASAIRLALDLIAPVFGYLLGQVPISQLTKANLADALATLLTQEAGLSVPATPQSRWFRFFSKRVLVTQAVLAALATHRRP